MASLRYGLGKLIENVGERYNLPEWGLSEKFAGVITPRTGIAPTSRGIKGVPQMTVGAGTVRQTTPSVPSVQGIQTGLPPRTGYQASSAPNYDVSAYTEPIPDAPNFNDPVYTSGYDEAISGYNDLAASMEAGSSADIAGIESSARSNAARQESFLKSQEEAAALQEQKQTQESERQTNRQRSALSEVLQGLQSRFGGSGPGQFMGELSYRASQQNIGEIQTNLVNNIQEIGNRIAQVRDSVKLYIDESNKNAQDLIAKAKSELQGRLASIRTARGELQARKSERAYEAMNRYQDIVREVTARNTAFAQQVKLQAMEEEARGRRLQQDLALQAQQYDIPMQNLPLVQTNIQESLGPNFGITGGRIAGGGAGLSGLQFGRIRDDDDINDLEAKLGR